MNLKNCKKRKTTFIINLLDLKKKEKLNIFGLPKTIQLKSIILKKLFEVNTKKKPLNEENKSIIYNNKQNLNRNKKEAKQNNNLKKSINSIGRTKKSNLVAKGYNPNVGNFMNNLYMDEGNNLKK